jgi:hypothetical protein
LVCPTGKEPINGKCLVKCATGSIRNGDICSSTCSANSEIINGKCLVKCVTGYERKGEICKEKCLATQELVGGKCVDKCVTGYTRDYAGYCHMICPAGQEAMDKKDVIPPNKWYLYPGDEVCVSGR